MDRRRNDKKKKFQYSPSKVGSALKAIQDGMKVSTASKQFNVPRTTLRNKISNISPAESTGDCGPHSILGKETEEKLVEWIVDCANKGFPVNKFDLYTSVKKLLDEGGLNVPLFKDNCPGKKWFYAFLKRHPVISQKHAEYVNRARGSVTEEKIRAWFKEVQELLKDDVSILTEPNRVFNLDETSFYLSPKGDLILGPCGRQVYDESSNSDKESVTTLFTVDANGKYAPPLTIYKYKRIPDHVVKSAPPGWGLGKTENGWMTGESFYEYITNVFLPYLKKNDIPFPVIVFLDGHRSHLTLHLTKFCKENQIILVALHPNSTHILQPLDVSVFYPLKHNWKKMVRKWRINNENKEITKSDIPKVLSTIIEDPRMESNVRSGFKATGLFPFNPENVDYRKCIVRKTPQSSQVNGLQNEDIKKHLSYLESKISLDVLEQFKQTKKRNHEWEGDPRAALLFDVWEKVFEECSTLSVEAAPDQQLIGLEKEVENGKFIDQTNDHNYTQPLPTDHMKDCNLPVENFDQMDDLDLNLNFGETFLSPALSLTDLMAIPQTTPGPSTTAHSSGELTSTDVVSHKVPTLNCSTSDGVNSAQGESPCINKPPMIQVSPKSLASIFDDVIKWPEAKVSKSKNQTKVHIPVITSDKYIQYLTIKEEEKKEKERVQKEKKIERDLKRKRLEASKALQSACGTSSKKKIKKQTMPNTSSDEANQHDNILKSTQGQELICRRLKKLKGQKPKSLLNDLSSDEDNELWEDSGDSIDDVELGMLSDPEDVDIMKTNCLKTGNFVLAKFSFSGKRSQRETEYKYVAAITKEISDNEFEIQCFKSVNSIKTQFVAIENDISQINVENILGKLPEPTLKEEGRLLVNEFPGAVKTVEKH